MSASKPARAARPRATSCGVLVSDGERVLLGHAAGSPRWDIPKGLMEPGESAREAAVRELREETGLVAPPHALVDLGLHAYRPGKDLALFLWRVAQAPEAADLACASTFTDRFGRVVPEFDRFAFVPWAEARGMIGKSLAAVLRQLGYHLDGRPAQE
jgi:8-oxo-dGTP pyrophosphatase MutT (NUDIX family)